MKKLPKINTSKLLKAALPYILVGLMATKLGQAYRMASGGDVLDRIFGAFLKIGEAFTNPLPSLHPFDLLVGAACGALLWFIVYQKSKNARKYRRGAEYGTARWGNAKDIEPFIDPDFSQNILLSETERLTLGKIADPEKRNVNLNVLVIGGSGSGKTRYHIKPNLLQMNASYVCSDPKGTVIEEVGRALVRGGYKIKVLNTIDFSCSMHYKDDPNVWIVDEEAAVVVRRIFHMTMDGYGPYQIARTLKEDKVEIPAVHMAKKDAGLWKGRVEEIKDPYGWGSSTVAGILKKREYLGHTVNFKTRKHFKDKKSHYVSEDNWTVFENTQEAIIDQETFDNVQRIRSNVRRYPDGWGEAHPLTGLMYCADCGSKMYVHRVNNGKRVPQYTCSAYSKVPVGTLCQTQHRINADVVMELIKELLKAVAEYSQLNREEFLETVKKAQTSQQSSEITRLKNRLAEAKKRVQELEKLICRIYEDNILGKLPDERYAILDGQYSKEQKDLSAEIADMEAELSGYEEGRRSAEKFIALVDKYQNFDELTTYMLNEFVEKIVVHERDRKGSIETTQEVEIYFNFIGKYLPPHFGEVEMTPEEIEEMKKREARKDRLHQNYLKRKANGKQQEYYERTKAKKKAEMDAKKEEIRQEDIAKGVFIPVSLLPPAEPKKGVASA